MARFAQEWGVLMEALDELALLLRNYPGLTPLQGDILSTYRILTHCFTEGGKLLLCGNGGSAADSEHIAGELLKGFKLRREIPKNLDFQGVAPDAAEFFYTHLQGGLPAIALTGHSAYATAWCNDVEADLVFAQQVYTLAKPEDVLFALSTSGNSKNVVNAVMTARAKGLLSIALTGEAESSLSTLCDCCIRVPAHETFRVQEYHLPIYHALCAMLEKHFFGEESAI